MPYKNIEDKRAWGRRYAKVWRRKNLARLILKEREKSRKRQRENPEQVRAWRRAFHHRNKERLKETWAVERKRRVIAKAAYDREYRERNAAHMKEYRRQWNEKNRERQNGYHRQKRRTDPQYRIKNNLRCRMNTALRKVGIKRDLPLERLIGCTVVELMAHLEARFGPGMSWQSREKWHVDHILPCAKFDLTDRKQQLKCFHFTNLQPLWAGDNIRKSASVAASE
jgi:hypothetical protein